MPRRRAVFPPGFNRISGIRLNHSSANVRISIRASEWRLILTVASGYLAWWSGTLACYHMWAGSFVAEPAKSRHGMYVWLFLIGAVLMMALVVWSIRGLHATMLRYERESRI